MKKLKNIKILFCSILCIIVIMMFCSDIICFFRDSETYCKVYRIGEIARTWPYKSIKSFIVYHILMICILFIYLTYNLLYMIKKTNCYFVICIFDFVLLYLLFNNIYKWYLSGFDIP